MFRLRLVERVKVFALLHLFVKLFSLGDTCTHVGLSLRLFGGKSFRACTKKRGKYYSITLGNKDGGKEKLFSKNKSPIRRPPGRDSSQNSLLKAVGK